MSIGYTDKTKETRIVKGINSQWLEWHTLEEILKIVDTSSDQKKVKRSVVFYIGQLSNEDKSVNIFVPYKGDLDKIYLSTAKPVEEDLICNIKIGLKTYGLKLQKGQKTIFLDISGEINFQECIFTIIAGNKEVEGINAILDFMEKE